MNITLISPYSIIETYGIRMISACLKKAGHKTQLIFMLKEFLQKEHENMSTVFSSWMPEKSEKKYEGKSLEAMIDLSGDSDLIGVSFRL